MERSLHAVVFLQKKKTVQCNKQTCLNVVTGKWRFFSQPTGVRK